MAFAQLLFIAPIVAMWLGLYYHGEELFGASSCSSELIYIPIYFTLQMHKYIL